MTTQIRIRHEGRLVAPDELAPLYPGVDVEASFLMFADMGEWMAAFPCNCPAICVCDNGI